MTVTNGDIEVTKYESGGITSVHTYIEVKKGSTTVEVLEADSFGFADIIIKKDTVIIEYMPTVFYQIANNAFNYKIKLDTTISTDYWKQKAEGWDKIGKEYACIDIQIKCSVCRLII